MSRINDIATKKFVKEELEEVKEWVDTVFAKYKDETMTKLDEIVDLLQKDDQERTILSYQVSEHTDQLENHKKRIEKLEKSPLITPTPNR